MDQPTQTTEQVWPERPLGDYLAELRETGFTVLDNLVDEEALARIVAATDARIPELDPPPPEFDGRFGVPDGISWSQDICHAVTHPAALWLMRTYLQTDGIRFCHQPAMTVLRPAKDLLGEFPEEGWHADYPYHPDVYPDDRWRDEAVYGVQFNLCIDDFTLENGATQYVPGSHLACRWPPRAFNESGTRMGVAPHDEVVQMVAGAGAALIYDSRTWHRACPELNASGHQDTHRDDKDNPRAIPPPGTYPVSLLLASAPSSLAGDKSGSHRFEGTCASPRVPQDG
jgi:hypothetical protein